MMQFEFEARTGVSVSADEYAAIELVYMESDLNKDDFCRIWSKMNKTRISEYKKAQKERRKAEDLKWSIGEICLRFRGASSDIWESKMINHLNKKEITVIEAAGFDPREFVWSINYKLMKFAGIA